jgi:hypothetical protein
MTVGGPSHGCGKCREWDRSASPGEFEEPGRDTTGFDGSLTDLRTLIAGDSARSNKATQAAYVKPQ